MSGQRILEFANPSLEARWMRRIAVTEHPNEEFILERVWLLEGDTVDILHYDREGRPACTELSQRLGKMFPNPNRRARQEAILCRRCRHLNRHQSPSR